MDDGAVGIGDDKSVPGTNATVDLNALLGDKFTSTLIDLDLAIGALAAQAKADGENASGTYVLPASSCDSPARRSPHSPTR